MTEIHDVLYPLEETDTRVSHRRYDGKERLIAWRLRQDDHFLLFRVDVFRRVTLKSGEKLDVPETIQCRLSEYDLDPSAVFAAECAVSYDAYGNVVTGAEPDPSLRSYTWSGGELEVELPLQCNKTRWCDPTPGRWIGEEPLGHEPRNNDFYRYPQ
jgi:hypothetical protein